MEIVRVELERDLLERRNRVHAVTGMELAQRGAEHPVLEPAQDAIAEKLVERHAAAQGAGPVEHA